MTIQANRLERLDLELRAIKIFGKAMQKVVDNEAKTKVEFVDAMSAIAVAVGESFALLISFHDPNPSDKSADKVREYQKITDALLNLSKAAARRGVIRHYRVKED